MTYNYGNDPNNLFTSDCGARFQEFNFIPVSIDEVMITVNGQDRCIQRTSIRTIELRRCDAENDNQKWYAVDGGFNEEKFELGQKGAPGLCVSQEHHPREGMLSLLGYVVLVLQRNSLTKEDYWTVVGERLFLEDCETAREPNSRSSTSFWNLI